MPQVSERSLEAMGAFQAYAKSGDKARIDEYSLEGLRRFEIEYGERDLHSPFRTAMRQRIKELEAAQSKKEANGRRVFDFLGGIVVGVVVLALARWLWP